MARFITLLAASQLALARPSTWCPDWFDDIGPQWMSESTDIPNVQLTVRSPKCSLHCSGAWNSPAFADDPPLQIGTPNRLASVTKPFTALTVLKLVEDGVVDVNASVTAYLPEWGVANLEKRMGSDEDAHRITPWMLLHHTSGLGATKWTEWQQYILTHSTGSITQRETLEWWADNAGPWGSPGEGFQYSDNGYIYLGLMIEHMTGKPLAAAVREAAHMDELGLSSTYWEVYEQHPAGAPPRASHYSGPINVTPLSGTWFNYGGTGLLSNGEDLAKFARAFHRGELLGPEGMEMALTTVWHDGNFDGDGYACGWSHVTWSKVDAWYHRGAFGSWMYYVPKLDMAITGTVNQMTREKEAREKVREIVEKLVDDGACRACGSK